VNRGKPCGAAFIHPPIREVADLVGKSSREGGSMDSEAVLLFMVLLLLLLRS
jgi:hypothetical protein